MEVFMPIKKENDLGRVTISEEAIAQMCGAVVCECYGVVGVASQQVVRDGWYQLLNKDNYSKGIVVRKGNDGLEIDVYIMVAYGIRVSEVVSELQNRLTYELEKTLQQEIKAINVYVQGVKKIA